MQKILFTVIIACTACALFAQESNYADTAASAPAPVQPKKSLRMFAAAQTDSVLSLIPGIDSLRSGSGIIGAGLDTLTGDIVVIAFDNSGNPAKFVYPASSLTKSPALPLTAAPDATAPATAPQKAASAKAPKIDQKGRTWFILETTLKSCVLFPLSYSSAFKHANEGAIAGASLLSIGGTLYGAFAFTKGMELGYGRVGLMNYGSSFLGLQYPALFGSALKNTTSIDGSDTAGGVKTSEQVSAWFSLAGFPLGIYLGSRWNVVDRNDAGRVTLMGYFSQPTAYLLGYALPFYFLYPAKERRQYFGASALLTMALMPAGFYAGNKLAGDGPLPTGRGSLPYVSGIMGGLTGLFVPMLFDLDYGKVSTHRLLVTTALAGYTGGTALGLTFQPSKEYTYWQTVFIGASSGAGALMGIAFPLIGQVKDNHKPFMISGLFGGWLGFLVGDYLSGSLFERSGRDREAGSLSVTLPGLAALPALFTKKNSSPSRLPAMPLANLEWRF